jgi:hypothetical protein
MEKTYDVMKRLLFIMVAAMIAISPVFAQTKRDVKSAKKEAKMAAKNLMKEGYRLLELGDLEMQLEDYLLKAKSGQKQIVGTAEGCMSINLAKTTALNNAINEYATMSGGMVKGRITSNTSSINGQQVDDIVAAYERLVLKEIKGEIQTCVTLVKESKKKYDVRVYCLVDYDAAHAARMKAMRLALEELELTQEYGSAVSDWIDEGLTK